MRTTKSRSHALKRRSIPNRIESCFTVVAILTLRVPGSPGVNGRMVLDWAMTAGASVRLDADEMVRLGVSMQPPRHVFDALQKVPVRVQLATWIDGAVARWPTIWERAERLARTWITWRESQRVQFSAGEIDLHDKRTEERMAEGQHAAELADFLAVGDIVRRRDDDTAAAHIE